MKTLKFPLFAAAWRCPLVLTALALAGPSAALAAPTLLNYVTGAVAQGSGPPTLNIGQQTQNQASVDNTSASAIERASASANLSTGVVRARAENQVFNDAGAWGAFATAYMGDGFSHQNGANPFNWVNQQASFTVRIDGVEQINPGPGDVFNFGMAFLIVYRAGTLDDYGPFCNGPADNGVNYNNILASYFWSIGSGVDHPCAGSQFNGNLSGNVDRLLTATFSPGGDFDWIFGVRVGGAFNGNLAPGNRQSPTWLQDFSNTATLSYQPPAGATVSSRSGVFPSTNTAAVPEPGSMLLVALGLAVAAAVRQKGRP